jgi:hypothetical protein
VSNAIHYEHEHAHNVGAPLTACGRLPCFRWTTATPDRSGVTCKRCLAALAKRDRAFQRKARAHYAAARWLTLSSRGQNARYLQTINLAMAASAIAAEITAVRP